MRINQVEELVGISKKNIRFYEEEGLIKPQRNAENGYREYTLSDVEVLQQIKFFRKLSIPIEEIRKMRHKYLTLSDCIERHLVMLTREEKNLECTKEICKEILSNKEQLELIRVSDYLAKMEDMEKDGVRFRDVKSVDKKKKLRTSSLLAGAIMILFFCLTIAVLLSVLLMYPDNQPPIAVTILLLVVPVGMIIGILLALKARLKEIKGGELDEASNY